jgi:hypothetical protein
VNLVEVTTSKEEKGMNFQLGNDAADVFVNQNGPLSAPPFYSIAIW